jgi:hypothetical protein
MYSRRVHVCAALCATANPMFAGGRLPKWSSGIAAATTWPSQCESLLQRLPSRLVVALAAAPTGS